MCGIAGIVAPSGRASLRDAERMGAILAHRGPDDSGTWLSPDGRVALAHRRLSILDLSPAGHQPMEEDGGALCLVFNGEIYNFVELRAELEAKGHRFRSGTDTEVILKAYREWGTDCLARFNGMFAFALWDERRGRLFAARDRFGEKPFYYQQRGGFFLFASEIKAVLTHPAATGEPDQGSLLRYLALGRLDNDENTFFAHVRQLRPAHYMLLEPGGEPRIGRYWDLDPERAVRHADDARYGEEFRELFVDSVRIRMRSDVPVGSSLSGGLDSSTVVCTIRTLMEGTSAPPQATFSARHRTGPYDEGRFIEQVVSSTGVVSHLTWVEGRQLADDVDRFLWHQDEPVPHTSQYAQWKVMELAKERGVTVLLDGQGADEFLAGYPSPSFGYRYATLVRQGRLLHLARELADYHRNHGRVTGALRYTASALLPAALWKRAKMSYTGTAGLLRDGLAPAEAEALQARFPGPAFRSPLKRILYETLTRTSLPALLRFGDRSSMAFSREARLPFLDHRLVEYAFALPDEKLVNRGTTKVVLRDATRGLLPEGVRMRMDKIGFGTPEQLWFRDGLRPWIEDRLEGAKRRGMVDPEGVDRLWGRVLAGGGDTGSVWRIANTEHWLRAQGG